MIPGVILAWGICVEILRANQKTLGNLIEPLGLALLAVTLMYVKAFLVARPWRSRPIVGVALIVICALCTIGSVLVVPSLPE